METFKDVAKAIAVGALVIVGLGAVLAGIEMWLWNQVMPDLFGLKQLTYVTVRSAHLDDGRLRRPV